MLEKRLHITPGMRRILDYPRFAGPTRMLILSAGYFFDASWARAAAELGWQTAHASSVIVGSLTRDQVTDLFTAIGAFKPDFILASNYAGMDTFGLFSRFFEDARIPYVSWFTDTPRMILYDRECYTSHYAVAATWERAYIAHFRRLGFEHVHFMPLATDPFLFSGAPAESTERELAFVGSSMTKEASEAWEKLEPLSHVTQAIHDAFREGLVTRERFAEGVDRILPPDLVAGLDRRDLRHTELCLVYEATRRQRAALVRRLDPLGIEVRGDPLWHAIAARAGGAVGYFNDLAPFYRRTAVNLNTTSLQMKSAVNQRVFDCPAAGGFLITDAQADLFEFFEPDEAIAYRTLDELDDLVQRYLRSPEERRAVVLRAQRRIAAHHTHRHRLEDLERFLKERYAL